MAKTASHQLLRPLTDTEYVALKASIAEHGVLVPVELDEHGNILDGHHRVKICAELGKKEYPRILRPGLTEEEKREHILTLNHDRRHLTKEERDALARELPGSSREVAERLGVSHPTVLKARAGGKHLPPGSRVKGRDGKTYPAKRAGVFAATRADAKRAGEALQKVPPESLPEKVLTTKRVTRLAREYEAGVRAQEVKGDVRIGNATLLLGDLWGPDGRELDVPAGGVDLIFTDPPYEKQSLASYEGLALMAARTLTPGGILATYCGCLYLDEVFHAFQAVPEDSADDPRSTLEYIWAVALILPGLHARIHVVSVANGWRPILFFRKHDFGVDGHRENPASLRWAEDTYHSEGPQKEAHDWQQSLGCARYYIEKLCPPAATVLDPFLGAGTTGLAALSLGRDFIGIERDKAAFAVAEERLKNAELEA